MSIPWRSVLQYLRPSCSVDSLFFDCHVYIYSTYHALICHGLRCLHCYTISRPVYLLTSFSPILLILSCNASMQHLLGNVKVPLLNVLEHCLIDAVCEVGVDLSLAVQNDHLATMLAFVGGLGKMLKRAVHLIHNCLPALMAVTVYLFFSLALSHLLSLYLSPSSYLIIICPSSIYFFLLYPILPRTSLTVLPSPPLLPSLAWPIPVPSGLRKAEALKQSIRRKTTSLVSRNELLEKKLMNPVVWTNAIGESALALALARVQAVLFEHWCLLLRRFDTGSENIYMHGREDNLVILSFFCFRLLTPPYILELMICSIASQPLPSETVFHHLPTSLSSQYDMTGFLRIADSVADQQLDPLDNTRIHPECYVTYDFAPKICADALEVDANPRWRTNKYIRFDMLSYTKNENGYVIQYEGGIKRKKWR